MGLNSVGLAITHGPLEEASAREADLAPDPASKSSDTIMGKELRRQMGILLPSELAAMLDCKETTLLSWRMSGVGPDFVKISKMIYYRIVDIQEWMNANVKVTTRTMVSA